MHFFVSHFKLSRRIQCLSHRSVKNGTLWKNIINPTLVVKKGRVGLLTTTPAQPLLGGWLLYETLLMGLFIYCKRTSSIRVSHGITVDSISVRTRPSVHQKKTQWQFPTLLMAGNLHSPLGWVFSDQSKIS